MSRFRGTISFFSFYLIFFIYGFLFLFTGNHGDLVIWTHQNHTAVLDFFFKYWTYSGGGWFFTAVALALFFKHRRSFYVFMIIGAVQGLISLLFKQVIFVDTPRPRKFFEGQDVLRFIDGVRIHDYHSFPSGHTITAFSIAVFFAFTWRSSWKAFLLFVGASLTAFSRIYVGQHFLIDILVGSLMGTLIATSIYLMSDRYIQGR